MARPSIPIIQGKLTAPVPAESYLPRPRLDRVWKSWDAKRIVLVTAGAGFGKTSFVAANAVADGRRLAWYTLDELDRDISTFSAHLCHSLHSPEKKIAPFGEAGGATEADHLLASVIRLLRACDRGTMIVLDDFHLVSGTPAIERFLEKLAVYLPDRSTLVLSSREQPGIATMKLRSRGDVAELTTADLRFDETEVRALFRARFPGADLDRRLVRRVVARTEGWAAGLAIFFQMLEDPSPLLVEEVLTAMSAAGSGWFTYFAEEVVRRLDPESRRFLRRTSVLPRLDATLCDALLGAENSHQILEDLCNRNLFTFRTGDAGDSFRYHHLFREFLRDSLRRTEGGATIRKLQRRAAFALEKEGARVETVIAFVEAGDYKPALRLVEKVGEDLLAAGQFEATRGALARIPAKLLDEHPSALLVLGRATEIHGEVDEAETIYRRATRRTGPGPLRMELMTLTAQNLLRRGEYRKCMTLCRKALDEPGKKPAQRRGRILNMLGIAACELGKLDEAEKHLKEVIALSRKGGDREGRAFYLLPVNIHYRRGDLQRAKEAARRALLEFKKQKDRYRMSHSLGVLAFITGEAGEVREARALAGEGLRMAESLDYPLMQGYCHLALGRCSLVDGNHDSAREHVEAARRLGEQTGESGLRTVPLTTLVEISIAGGDRAKASRQARLALEAAAEMKDIYQEAVCLTLLGLLKARSRRKEAAGHWKEAEKTFRRVGIALGLHRLLLIRLSEGRVPEKERPALLEELLAGAADLDHDFLFLVFEPERAAAVLPEAIRLGIETEYAEKLLASLGERVVSGLAALIDDESDPVRERVIRLLARIGGDEARRALVRAAGDKSRSGKAAGEAAEELGRTPETPLTINALGSLTVEAGGRLLRFEQWKSKRALRLFQFLLVHRFRWVPREMVIENLWPETAPSKGMNNLRQTIHLLRKTLEPDLKEAKQSRYVRFRNETCRLEAGTGSSYDADRFEKMVEKGNSLWHGKQRKKTESIYAAAIGIYHGPFLAESPYEEFAAEERERLRELLLRATGRLLTLYREKKRWHEMVPLCRKALLEDPYQEDFHYCLVEAETELGNRREALNDYNQYEEMMIRELDLLPSSRMKTLAEKTATLGR